MIQEAGKQVPIYLFHTVSDQSQGTCTTAKVASPTLKTTAAFSNIAFDHAKGMIENHLLRRPFPNTLLNLSRGVALFLSVLQLSVYRVYGNQDSNFRICIVNTSKAKPAPSYPARNLLRILRHQERGEIVPRVLHTRVPLTWRDEGCRHFQDCDD
jgi:hypothetical protein